MKTSLFDLKIFLSISSIFVINNEKLLAGGLYTHTNKWLPISAHATSHRRLTELEVMSLLSLNFKLFLHNINVPPPSAVTLLNTLATLKLLILNNIFSGLSHVSQRHNISIENLSVKSSISNILPEKRFTFWWNRMRLSLRFSIVLESSLNNQSQYC